jgi:hypothetical protein
VFDTMMALSIMNAVRCIRPDTVLLYWLMQYDVGCLYTILVLNGMSVYHTSNSSLLKENCESSSVGGSSLQHIVPEKTSLLVYFARFQSFTDDLHHARHGLMN